jgi:hypothetical protein
MERDGKRSRRDESRNIKDEKRSGKDERKTKVVIGKIKETRSETKLI